MLATTHHWQYLCIATLYSTTLLDQVPQQSQPLTHSIYKLLTNSTVPHAQPSHATVSLLKFSPSCCAWWPRWYLVFPTHSSTREHARTSWASGCPTQTIPPPEIFQMVLFFTWISKSSTERERPQRQKHSQYGSSYCTPSKGKSFNSSLWLLSMNNC